MLYRLSVRENGGDANCRLTANIARALDNAKAMVKSLEGAESLSAQYFK